LQWFMQPKHAKLGWNAPFRGYNPHFGGARSVKNYQTLMYSSYPNVRCEFHVNWRRSIFAPFLNFLQYLWPPNFAVFGGLCTPLQSWWTTILMTLNLLECHVFLALVDWNRMISLDGMSNLMRSWPQI
jgi:hypothetical protein